MAITIYSKKRNFLINSPAQERGATVSVEAFGVEILWDDLTDIQWDDGTQILWSTESDVNPILIHAKKRNFLIISPAR